MQFLQLIFVDPQWGYATRGCESICRSHFYDANRTRHCREIYLPRTSLSEVDTSPQKRHRWRCRLIPSVLGAPRGDFFTIPAQNLAYGMRYNAGNGGVQLSVNLISRLEEERPTRLYACREWIRTPDQALGNSRFSRLGHPGGLPTMIRGAFLRSHPNLPACMKWICYCQWLFRICQ